ncbi:MAG: DNA-processing protein DprA [Vulcanimicrobiota bacterium]
MNTVTIILNTTQYPRQLADALGRSAPGQLDCRGNLDLLRTPAVGFSGSRQASAKGLEQADTYARQLAREGWTIVSGHASGVDVTSHRAALAAGGSTILVLPHGMDQFRLRPELQAVWDWRRALVVSPYEPQAAFKPFRAIQRNAVIAGLSQGVVVFEAGNLGGTLNTGLTTLKLKKPLFAAIYEEMPPTATGNRLLIARGARPLETDRDAPANHTHKMAALMEQAATRIAVGA